MLLCQRTWPQWSKIIWEWLCESVCVCFVLESSLYPEDAPEAVVVEHCLQNASPSFHGINWCQGFELKQGYCLTQAKIIWCCIFGLGNCIGWTHEWCLSYSWPCSESLCCTFRDTPILASFPIVTEDSPLRFITGFYLGLSCREIFVLVFLCVVSLFFLNKPLSKKWWNFW